MESNRLTKKLERRQQIVLATGCKPIVMLDRAGHMTYPG
jgi:hypothetical protein